MKRAALAFPLVALACALPSAGAPPTDSDMLAPFPHPKGYVCCRAPSPIAIDGDLTDVAWAAAPWTDGFVDIEGDKRPKPPHRTRVKMLWDDEALYIAAELEESHVWGMLKDHDSVIFHDNDFEVFLDPDGDNHLYGELELNALNTTWDLLLTKPYKDGGRAVNAWEISGLRSAVKVHGTLNDPRDKDTGWTVEIRWPWKGLQELASQKLPPQDGEQWRVNFSRVEWDVDIADGKYFKLKGREEHNWVWSPQGVVDMHRPERWGYVQFSTAKPGEAKFRSDPDWDIKDALHRAYYAQRAHAKRHGKFAPTAADLGLEKLSPCVQVQAARRGFEVTWVTDGKPRYSLTSDGQLRKE